MKSDSRILSTQDGLGWSTILFCRGHSVVFVRSTMQVFKECPGSASLAITWWLTPISSPSISEGPTIPTIPHPSAVRCAYGPSSWCTITSLGAWAFGQLYPISNPISMSMAGLSWSAMPVRWGHFFSHIRCRNMGLVGWHYTTGVGRRKTDLLNTVHSTHYQALHSRAFYEFILCR